MNEHTGAIRDAPVGDGRLMENEYVKELFSILQNNNRDTAGLDALLGHVKGMEDFVKLAEDRIADMKSQLDDMREIQNHPVKTALQNAIKTLEAKVEEVRKQLSELKSNIIEGCKNAVTAFKEKGITALDNLASFFHIKKGLQVIKNDIVKSVDICDKAVTDINTFAKEYHTAGRALKNMARVAVGKKPLDAQKEAGKLARAVGAPYRAEKACLLGMRKAVNAAIGKLEQLEQGAESKRNEKAATKKPTLTERINANKERIKRQEREKPIPERAKSQGLEV